MSRKYTSETVRKASDRHLLTRYTRADAKTVSRKPLKKPSNPQVSTFSKDQTRVGDE